MIDVEREWRAAQGCCVELAGCLVLTAVVITALAVATWTPW
ncbi:hypothetical protein [Embleya sp. AB8]